MRVLSVPVCLILLPLGLGPGLPEAVAQSPGGLSLEGIFVDELHDGVEAPSITWIEGGNAYLIHETDESNADEPAEVWVRHDCRSGKTKDWLRMPPLDLGDGESVEIEDIVLSDDERMLLLETNNTKRWRYSYTADHWIYDREQKTQRRLTPEGQEIHAKYSPDSKYVGFVRQGNLYVTETASGRTRPLTKDGSDVVFNGDPDWVYEEELEYLAAWWWSPDSRYIAFLHTDSRAIGHFPLTRTGDEAYPELQMLPYPKAGTDNSTVTLVLMNVDGSGRNDLRTLGPDDGYFARVDWAPNGTLTYQWINRDQNELQLSAVDPVSGEATLLLEEKAPSGWVQVDNNLTFFDQRPEFLWTSERDGFEHLYHYDLQGNLKRQITSGPWEVRAVERLLEKRGEVLLTTGRDDHTQSQLDRVDLKSGKIDRWSQDHGWYSVDVSPNGRYVVETRSSIVQRPVVALRKGNGDLVRHLVEDDMADLQVDRAQQRFTVFENADGLELSAHMILPPNFDPNVQYPAVIYTYAGPESQRVRDMWGGGRHLFHLYLAQRGYVVFTADGRGTGGRGRDFKHQVYKRLGLYEVDDQLAAVDHLAALPYVDGDRIAIWGWSYGGYVSAGAMFRGEGKVAAAVAVAPVSDWRFYDTIYTERYMSTPQKNADGYKVGAPISYVNMLEGPFLLVHGMSDDNVHPQNSMHLMDALQEAGKPFELMMYPNKAHSISGGTTRLHLYRTMESFLERHVGPGTILDPGR